MTTLARKLKIAGVESRPVIERVWQFVKDIGPHTATEVATALGLSVNNVSSTLGILCDRAMMTSKVEVSPQGHKISRYTAATRMKKYQLLPITKAAKERIRLRREKRKAPEETSEVFTQAGTANLPAVEAPKPDQHILDRLSVREAYALYQELRTMFNPGTAPTAPKS